MKLKKRLSKIVSAVLACAMIFAANGIHAAALASRTEDMQIFASADGERRVEWGDSWKFHLGNPDGAQKNSFDDSGWQDVTLPHDWSIYFDFNLRSSAGQTAGFLDGGTGWYRKSLVVTPEMQDKRITLNFDGVIQVSTVYVNGLNVGKHFNGYTSFSYDITDQLHKDGSANVIAVKVENTTPSERWYSGSGIYRNVYLTMTEDIYVGENGTYLTTPTLEEDIRKNIARVEVKTHVVNASGREQDITLQTRILDADGGEAGRTESTVASAAGAADFEQDIQIENPRLWSAEDPYLYTAVSTVMAGGRVVDRYETTIGLRYFKFDSNEGFSLNGEYMKLRGVCMHHDLGALGAAVNYRATERQVEILKEMGVNAIRTSHNPASPELIEICNKMGVMVMEEAFDIWTIAKSSNDYSNYFMANAESDIKSMVNRDKNAPSVIIWSIGNEIPYDSNGVQIAENLNRWVKEVDTTRPTTIAENKHNDATARQIFNIVDLVGFNYPSSGTYSDNHRGNPNWIVYGSETSSAIRSRGVYYDPNNKHVGDNWTTRQCSSYDNQHVSWGRTAQEAWRNDRDRKYVAGQFIWTGFDYIGEPTPYWESPKADTTEIAKSSYFGIVDTAGFPKDTYYLYQSVWTEEPMVHLLPHWNWNEGDTVQVWAYSNVDTVELFLNGESLGEKRFITKTTDYGMQYLEAENDEMYLKWDIAFEPGELKAVAKKDGRVMATDVVRTANSAHSVKLTPDRRVIDADGRDLSFITVDIVDNQGTLVPDADNLVSFEVTGGVIKGVDNGNAISLERYQDDKRKAFNGKALLIVASDGSGGPIRVTAKSAGLAAGTTTVYAQDKGEEQEILGLEPVRITQHVGQRPQLPETVTAVCADGSEKQLSVVWEQLPESLLMKAGSFQLAGTVDSTAYKAQANITMIAQIGVIPYSAVTALGQEPKLPAEAGVLYSDGSTEKSAVVWDEIDPERYASEGVFTVTGAVQGTDFPAQASVRVKAQGERTNIALKEHSDANPTAVASYTNGDDSAAHLNDGAISYRNSPKNRWSNWQWDVRRSDYIGISWDTAQNISEIIVHFPGDSAGGAMPATMTVQYLDAAGAVQDAQNVQMSDEAVADDTNAHKITFTFDPVITRQIRLLMTNDTDKCLCVTEFEVMGSVVAANTSAALDSLLIDGEPLAGFDNSTPVYELLLEYGGEIPSITAMAKDNGSVYVVPPVSLPGDARIVVTSESGSTQKTYVVQLYVEPAPLAEVTIETPSASVTEDDILPITLTARDMDGTLLAENQYTVSYTVSDEDAVKIRDGRAYLYREGTVDITAAVTYHGETRRSNTITLTIGKAPYERVITGFEPISVTMMKGANPVLPEKVTAVYDRGLARELPVTWDVVSDEQCRTLGTFQVAGTVEGTGIRPAASVFVRGVVAVQSISTGAIIHEKPKLPETVAVYYNDGIEAETAVVWDDIPKEQYDTAGTFTVEGSLDGLTEKAKATVRVTDQYERGMDISVTKNGYYLPKIEASYTNGDDKLSAVSDDIISFNDNPKNRWSNWKNTADETAWISYIFGMEDETVYYLNNAAVYFYKDWGCYVPSKVEIQYWNGESWVPVPGQQQQEETVSDAGSIIRYTFDKIYTSRIRFFMTAQPEKSIAITEIKMYADSLTLNTGDTLSDLKIDGRTIEGFDPEKLEYTVRTKDGRIPELTAFAQDNAAVTVIPALQTGDTARILVVSEGRSSSRTYQVHFLAENLLTVKEGGTVQIDREHGYLAEVGASTTAAQLSEQLTASSGEIVLTDAAGNVLEEDVLVHTGCTVKLMEGDEEADSLRVAVRGDVNGDGILNITDLIMTKSAVLGRIQLDGVYRRAADCQNDQSINIFDLVKMKLEILS
ncbi:Ig-like domain-containing protein [Candidatus Soleaferrea massiliensis]|uniref:Ig-like domain-containing protein n=1 Tax=Candidatus Soleaferrea massiliensis TaxID=1470354 RepID=UPI00069412FA|nr:Ig-like domain-containing protein [Candidatus Soleaferrea massiliensis]